MSEMIHGKWYKMKTRCDYCGVPNRKDLTYVVNSPEISGRFCSDTHAHQAWEKMKGIKNENI